MMKFKMSILVLLLSAGVVFSQGKTVENPVNKTEKSSGVIFKSQVYDFGTIEYESDATGVFEFKNISKKPIKLTNVKAACGCTGTEWTREAIAKKKKSKITVKYDTKRIGKFDKNIYVYIEGSENPIQLQVKGEVLAPQGLTKENPKSDEIKSKESIEYKPVNKQIKEMPQSKQIEIKKEQDSDNNNQNFQLKKQVDPAPLKKKIENE